MTICCVCGKIIGGNDNVSVIRRVQLVDGRSGWVAMHVRCAGFPVPTVTQRAQLMPPGKPLQLPMLEGVSDGV